MPDRNNSFIFKKITKWFTLSFRRISWAVISVKLVYILWRWWDFRIGWVLVVTWLRRTRRTMTLLCANLPNKVLFPQRYINGFGPWILIAEYAHRDVKSENILVRTASDNNTIITDVRLIDFGIVCRLDDEVSCRELCGTPGFIAPEVIWRQVEDARKADVWSLGCVVLERSVDELWFEKNWFDVNSRLIYRGKLTNQDLSFLRNAINKSLRVLATGNAPIFDFVQQTLILNPRQRKTFATETLELRPASTPSCIRRDRKESKIANTSTKSNDRSPNSALAFPTKSIDVGRQQRSNILTSVRESHKTSPLHVPGISSLPRLSPRTHPRYTNNWERKLR